MLGRLNPLMPGAAPVINDFAGRMSQQRPGSPDADPRMVAQPYADPGYAMPNVDIGNLNQSPGQEVSGWLPASAQNRLTPQDDPMDFSARYNTPLTPDEQQQYQQWLRQQSQAQGRDLSKDAYDYDMQGFWKNGAQMTGGHGGDQFKKPNHPTFSTGSQYSGQGGNVGGTWAGGQNGQPWTFTPGQTNAQYWPAPELQRYFASPAEAGRSTLVLPQGYGQ